MATRHQSTNTEPNDHGYDAVFDPPLDRKYTCPVCLLALKNPVQTKCGHRFCRACLSRCHSRTARFAKCPVDNQLVDETTEVFEDLAMKREVLSLRVKCPYYTDQCTWTGELGSLKDHEDTCPCVLIECNNEGCGQMIRRRNMTDHSAECPQRLQSCSHCENDVKVAAMARHQLLDCPRFPVTCSMCHATGILREDISKHVAVDGGDCPSVTIKCSFYHLGCSFRDKRGEMYMHYETACHNHLLLMSERLAQQDALLQEQGRQLEDLVTTCSQLTHVINSQHQEMTEYQEQLLSHSLQLHDVHQSGCNGRLLWKINLPQDNNCQIHSPPFFTGRPGYRLTLTLELAGFRDYNEIYSSLYVNLTKGSYDDQLTFPFEGSCCVTIKDQRRADVRRHFTTSIACSQVPRCWEDEGNGQSSRNQRGRLKLMKTNDLLGGRFVYQGCLLVQVEASHFNLSNSE